MMINEFHLIGSVHHANLVSPIVPTSLRGGSGLLSITEALGPWTSESMRLLLSYESPPSSIEWIVQGLWMSRTRLFG